MILEDVIPSSDENCELINCRIPVVILEQEYLGSATSIMENYSKCMRPKPSSRFMNYGMK